jgi:hypothetical protein
MDTLKKLLELAKMGPHLNEDDWKMLLHAAHEAEDLGGVLLASNHLNIKPPKDILESLLLTFIVGASCEKTFAVKKLLGRELDVVERDLLIEALILSGNTQDFFEYIQIGNKVILGMLHTTVALSAMIQVRKKRGLPPIRKINLKSWAYLYREELSLFSPKIKICFGCEKSVTGNFPIFFEETMNRFLGILLAEHLITPKCAQWVIAESL